MRLGIVLTRVMRVVGGDQWDPGALRQPGKTLIDPALLFQAVVLDLQEIIVAEHLLVLAGRLLGSRLVTLQQAAGDFAAKAAGQRDQPFGVLGEQRLVDPGLVVIPLQVREAGERDQVAIAGQVLDQKDQVVRVPVGSAFLLVSRAGGDVRLLADYRVDAGGFGLQVEIDRAVEHPVVGQGDRRHPGLCRQADHVRDPAGAVEQAVFGVRMKVGEAHAFRSSLTTASMW